MTEIKGILPPLLLALQICCRVEKLKNDCCVAELRRSTPTTYYGSPSLVSESDVLAYEGASAMIEFNAQWTPHYVFVPHRVASRWKSRFHVLCRGINCWKSSGMWKLLS